MIVDGCLQAEDAAISSSTLASSDNRKAALLAAATAVKIAIQQPTGSQIFADVKFACYTADSAASSGTRSSC